MKTQMFKILSGAAFAAVVLSGCNTTEGLGEDISKAGTAIAGAAHETGNKISGEPDKKATEVTHHHHVAHKKAAHKHHRKAKKVAVVQKADGEHKETTTTTTETKTETTDKK